MGENMMVDPNLASINDDVIIRIEMAELESMAEEQDSRKRDLVLAAAEKLAEKYAGDTTVVSAKLQALLSNDRRIGDRKIYGTVSKSYISDILPAEYKRAYAVLEPRDDTPLNAMEEMLARAADLAKSIGVIMQDTLTELQDLRQSGRPGDFEAIREGDRVRDRNNDARIPRQNDGGISAGNCPPSDNWATL